MTTVTKLANRVGDFKYESGCQSAQDFREAFQKQWNKIGEKGFIEMYEDYAAFTTDNRGILLSYYEYGNGGYGSCFVELVPYIDEYGDGKLKLFYDLYIETDGHLEDCGSFLVGNEDEVVLEFEKAMNKTTEEIAEDWRFCESELCKHEVHGIATFVRYESCGDESVIRLAKGNSSEEHEEIYVSSDSLRPYFA